MFVRGGSSKWGQYRTSVWPGSSKDVINSSDASTAECVSNSTSELVLESGICKEWAMGRCTKGEKCRFRHKKDTRTRHNRRSNSYGVWLLDQATNLQEVGDDVKKSGYNHSRGKHENAEELSRTKQNIDLDEVEKEEPKDDIDGADRMKMFEELGKTRRSQVATEKGDEWDAPKDKNVGEASSKEANEETEKDWVAGMLEELGRRRREQRHSIKQRLGQQSGELEEGIMRETEADQYPESDTLTEQYIVLESNLVTYGAGLQIHQLTPGYDLCQIVLQLPIGTTRTAIMPMLWEQGLENSDFHIIKIAETGRSVEAIIVTTLRFGMLLERNSFAFRNRNVTFHMRRDAIWTSGTLKGVQPSLTLTWDSVSTKGKNQQFSADSASIAMAAVYDSLLDSQGALMETCCLLTPETGATANQVLLMVEFDDWDNALKAARSMQAKRPKEIPSLVATTANPYQWSIAIPKLQYEAQIEQWLELSNTRNKEARIEITMANNNLVVRVHGNDMVSAGALKVRVEKLARGEVLEGAYWHPSFAYAEDSAKFLSNVALTARVHLTCHPDSRTLVAYGESQRVNDARKLIKADINRREQVVTKTTLPDASDAFFARGGFEKLKELVGEEKVDWKITSMWSAMTMKGGEEATHHLRRLIKESLAEGERQDETTCPVCFTDTLYPEMLECGHGYCSGCLDLFLKAAADNKKFPIVCVGEGATCNAPIPLSFIRRFLPYYTFKQLVEASFAAYLEQNPTQFRYCKTADCRQTYRRQPVAKARIITCPSCFSKTCSSCSEHHEKMSCEEYRVFRDPEEQERLTNALASTSGYKRCPRCAVWVEKTGGCNHMSCKCGAHICWICLGIFAAGDIYAHIATH